MILLLVPNFKLPRSTRCQWHYMQSTKKNILETYKLYITVYTVLYKINFTKF